jgi:hypothetical protein
MTTLANPKTFKERDDWIRAMNASGERAAVRCLAIAIAMELKVTTGRCSPSHEALHNAVGMKTRTTRSVERYVARLKRVGWLDVERGGGRDNNNSYILLLPATAMADQKSVKPATHVADNQERFPDLNPPQLWRDETRQPGSLNPPEDGGQKRAYRAKKESGKKERVRARSARDAHNPPDFDPVDPKKKTAARRKVSANSAPSARRQRKKQGDGAGAPASAAAAADMDAAFARFMSVYPKPVGIDAARKAWTRVIKTAGDAETAFEAAKRYAIERRGEPARYTRKPETFLKDGHWKDPPPDGLVLDGVSGEPVALDEQPQQPAPRRHYDPSAERWALAAQLKRELCGPQETEVDNEYLQ